MAHFGVLHLYTPLLLSHQKFTVDKLPLTSESGVYISAIHLVAMVYILHIYSSPWMQLLIVS